MDDLVFLRGIKEEVNSLAFKSLMGTEEGGF